MSSVNIREVWIENKLVGNMKRTIHFQIMSYMITITLLLPIPISGAVLSSRTIKRICSNQRVHNATAIAETFFATVQNVSDQIVTQGWGIASTGTGPDADYALAQCYDINLSSLDCSFCYDEARTTLPQCFPYNGGKIFLDNCFMRNDNYNFFQESLGPGDAHVCGNETRVGSRFQEAANRALLQAVSSAPDSNGSARVELPSSEGRKNESSVYVLASCWRTLSPNACRTCLGNASESLLKCLPWSEGFALYTGCILRYSNNNFLTTVPTNEDSSRGNVVVIVAVTVSSAIVLVVGFVIGLYIWKRKRIEKRRKASNDPEKLARTLHDSSLSFKYSTLEKATGSFDEANKLGQGGFGSVYKGVLEDGREIAVKRLTFNFKHRALDFYNEINVISSVEHKNLIRLLGCSCSGPESLLVYEFLPNLSLDRYIFDQNRGSELNWEKRFNIIVGIAEGLVYLHEISSTRIIHRDIKASNILLDLRFRAKIADFGLARFFPVDKSHISTIVAGTLGYLAPEYLIHGQLTEKVDVYSFGVLLLEIVTGKQNNISRNTEYTDSLANIVWMHFQEGKVDELFDLNLMLDENKDEDVKNDALRVIHIGLLCIQEVPSLRPSMSKVVQMLVKTEEELSWPSNPPYSYEKVMELNNTTHNNNSTYPLLSQGDDSSIANMSHSSFYPR